MINPRQFRDLIIRPTLEYLDMGGLAAERLLLGTALAESRLSYLAQWPEGPAKGVYQIEEETEIDIWLNYLTYRDQLRDKVNALGCLFPSSILNKREGHSQAEGNLYYATAMCRIHYRRVPEKLPDKDDAMGMALYHKKFYNSELGKADPEESVEFFHQVIDIGE